MVSALSYRNGHHALALSTEPAIDSSRWRHGARDWITRNSQLAYRWILSRRGCPDRDRWILSPAASEPGAVRRPVLRRQGQRLSALGEIPDRPQLGRTETLGRLRSGRMRPRALRVPVLIAPPATLMHAMNHSWVPSTFIAPRRTADTIFD